MEIIPLIAVAGLAIGSVLAAPAQGQSRTVIAVGGPAGPGWIAYHDRGLHRGWNGPRYWDKAGPHRGWYAWKNGYYQNCSYRWTRHHRIREWHCW